jgi:hypothetical protein
MCSCCLLQDEDAAHQGGEPLEPVADPVEEERVQDDDDQAAGEEDEGEDLMENMDRCACCKKETLQEVG